MAIHSPVMDTSPRIYDAVMAALDSKRIFQRTVADESGVPFSTVCKIAQRNVKDPSVHTVQQLYDYFSVHPLVAELFGAHKLAGSPPDGQADHRSGDHDPTVDGENPPKPAPVECGAIDPRHGLDRHQPDQRKADRRKEAV